MTNNLITLSNIQEALGLKVTGQFITETLGVKPHSNEKRAVYFTGAQFSTICDKLAAHCTSAKNAGFNHKTAPKLAAQVDEDDDL